jgi:DNA-binding MarR family transcriptional regulator
MVNRLASQAESLIGVLTETRKLEKRLESLTRLSSDALLVLLLIHTRRPSSVKELTGHLGVSDSRTSKLLCLLEDRGFITRRISLTDRRVEQISLTPRGDRIVEIALSVPASQQEEASTGWPLNIEPSINVLGILIGCAALICT